MSLPATESFTGTGSLSVSWTQQKNTVSCSSNEGKGNTAADDNFAYWNADTFSNDQYSQVKVGSTYGGGAGNGDYLELICRASGSNNEYLLYWSSGLSIIISKYVSGVQTDLQDTGVTAVSGDIIKIQASGTSLSAYKNGSQIGSMSTDSSLSSGAPGPGLFGTGARLDDWEGGNVGGAVATAKPQINMVIFGDWV